MIASLSAKTVAIIVAHPDDETLWAGGIMLNNPSADFFVLCLCRGKDEARAPRFFEALKALNAEGIMGDLDDSPEQFPLDPEMVEDAILKLLPPKKYDLIITHSLYGEYTRHRRHEEISRAVVHLWPKLSMTIARAELWIFAYTDNDKRHFPRAIAKATLCDTLTDTIWQEKYRIITKIYGFDNHSWEAQTTPKREAFWRFWTHEDVSLWIEQQSHL